jgi:hypothetical protein
LRKEKVEEIWVVNWRVSGILMSVGLCATLMQACSRPLAPQESCNFVQNPEQQRVSWNRNVPVKLYLHKSVPQEAYAAIDRAVEEINLKAGNGHDLLKIIARGADGALNPQKDGYSMIYWFKEWDGNRSEQARTTIYWQGAEIFEADMRINAATFSYNEGVDSNFTNVDLQSLVLHELGHVLGLAHNATTGSVMNITLEDGQDRRKLGTVDLASLKCEY